MLNKTARKFGLLSVLVLSFFFSASRVYSEDMEYAVNIHTEDILSIVIGGDVSSGSASVNILINNLNGVFNETGDITATVVATNQYGYTLGMDSSTSALVSTSNSEDTIDELTESEDGYAISSFPVNRWGYSLKSGESFGKYFGMGDGVELQNVSEPTLGTTSTMRFGAKVDGNTPNGSYETTIVFTLTAKPESRLYMQDVASWKNTLAINESVKAYDLRDGKDYWVTKLETDPRIPNERADCTGTGANRVCTQIWMTQNLDLDLSTETTFTHWNTDLGWAGEDETMVWTPSENTFTSGEFPDWDEFSGVEQSVEPGEKYYYTSNSNEDDIEYDSLEACISAGHTKDDCDHYHAGNYYNFLAANAYGVSGNGILVDFDDDEDENTGYYYLQNSVCPAGWRMPTTSTNITYTESNFYRSDYTYLFYKNGVTENDIGDPLDSPEIQYYSNSGLNKLRSSPLWFTRSGYYSYSYFYFGGDTGLYINNVFGLEGVGFDSWGADVAYLYDDHAWMVAQGYGFDFYPVRCIARAEYEPVTYIQDVTASTCPSEPTTVVDRRDGEEYTIQQLADGNCWMLDNLRLDPTNINVRHETTFHTTNASTNTLSYLEWGGGDTSDQYAIDGIANWTSGYSYSAPLINTTYKDTTGTGGYAAGKYGVYYNYCAASAGSYCYGDGTDPGTPSGIISEDICPKGWRLPNSGESQEIYRSYTSDYTRFVSAFHSSLPGYFDGAIQNQGSVGLYWTSSNYGSSNSNMYRLHVDASYVSTEDFGGRYNGYSIRCILK